MVRFFALLCCLALVVAAAWGDPADPEDRIRQLESQIQEQARQIEALQNSLQELKEQVGEQAPAEPEDTALEGGDPGPEPPPPLEPATTASSSATGQQPSMNPNISVIGLMGATAGGNTGRDDPANPSDLDEGEPARPAPAVP